MLLGCSAESGAPPAETQSFDLTRIADLKLPSAARAIAAGDKVVFVGLDGGGLVAVDVSEPLAPEVLAKLDDVRADALAFSEDRLFALARPQGVGIGKKSVLKTIDAVDPRAPRVVDTRELENATALAASAARAIVTAGDTVLVGADAQRPQSFETMPKESTAIAIAWRAERIAVVTAVPGGFLGRGAGVPQLALYESKGGKLANVSGAAGALELGDSGALAGCDAADLALTHDRAYVCARGHVLAIDLSDPKALKPVSDLVVPGARAVAAGRDFLVACGDGLVAIDLAAAAGPVIAKRAGAGTSFYDVAVAGDLAFVAAGDAGLRVYRVQRPATPVPERPDAAMSGKPDEP